MNCPVCFSNKEKKHCSKDGYDFYRCQDCGLLFVFPVPVDSEIKNVYKADYFNKSSGYSKFGYSDYDKDKEAMKPTFFSYLKEIGEYCKGRKLLDIGAATGYFMGLAGDQGYSVYGLEISEHASRLARTRGFDVLTGNLADNLFDDKFDVITAWDVIEHFDNQNYYFSAISENMKTGGILAINTVDAGSLWAKIWRSKWHAIMPPEHLYLHTRESLTELLNNNGFSVLKVKKIGKNFLLPYVFKMLYSWTKCPLFNWLYKIVIRFDVLRKVVLPINIRDNIFIISKKND